MLRLRKTVVLTVVLTTMLSAPASASMWDSLTDLFSRKAGSADITSENSVTSEDSFPNYLAKNWSKLTENLSNTLELQEKQESLPGSKWFGDDRTSNAKEINKLMDAALEILIQGRATDLRREAAALKFEIPQLRAEADRLRNERITAPTEKDWKQPWKSTKSDIDERIEKINQGIKDDETRLVYLNTELADAFRDLKLELDQAQIDVLMNSVTGDDLLQNAMIFSNVKIVVGKLEDLAQNDQNDLEINRRYTGMYLVLNDLLMHTQRQVVREIEENYKPQLLKIRQEAETIRRDADAKSRLSQYSPSQKNTFAKNAETNAMTIRVIDLYTQLLDRQRKDLLANIGKLQLNHDAAESTYKTVRNAGTLRNVIQSGLALFDSIQDFSAMPELQNFVDSGIMRMEFDEINRRLKSSN